LHVVKRMPWSPLTWHQVIYHYFSIVNSRKFCILTLGEAVYGEKRISIDNKEAGGEDTTSVAKIEYRVWNPFRLTTCRVIFSYLFPPVLNDFSEMNAGPSWLLLFLEVLIRYTCSLAQKYCI